jgi:hypothetical protein
MGFALISAVATPELIGVVLWWGLVLAAPLLLVRGWRRRRLTPVPRRRLAAPPRSLHPWDDSGPERGLSSPTAVVLTSDLGDPPNSGTPEARLPSGTLGPLCRYVDFRRRLGLAVMEVERRLSFLAADRWRIEPYPLTGERGNSLLVMGETGVFVISATYAPGHWDDVVAVSRLASKLQLLLPGYPGQVQPAICHPFTAFHPRLWHRADECGEWVGAWALGGDSLIGWLEHFGSGHGLGTGDLGRFDELATPNWLRPAIPAAPTWPPLTDTAPSHPQE